MDHVPAELSRILRQEKQRDIHSIMTVSFWLGCAAGAIAAALILLPLAAKADDGWLLNVHGASHHFAKKNDGSRFNEINYGLGIEREIGDFAIQAGAYRNSIDRTSVYATARWTPLNIAGVRVGAMAGVVTGYEFNGGGPTPAAALVAVTPEIGRVSMQVMAIPPAHPKVVSVVALSLRVRL